MTIDELRKTCKDYGVRPSEVARKFGYTTQWLYVRRKNELPEIVRYALLPCISEILSEQEKA